MAAITKNRGKLRQNSDENFQRKQNQELSDKTLTRTFRENKNQELSDKTQTRSFKKTHPRTFKQNSDKNFQTKQNQKLSDKTHMIDAQGIKKTGSEYLNRLVRMARLELARENSHYPLKVARLPLRHIRLIWDCKDTNDF